MKIQTAAFLMIFVIAAVMALWVGQLEAGAETYIPPTGAAQEVWEVPFGQPSAAHVQVPRHPEGAEGGSFGRMLSAGQAFFSAFADFTMEALTLLWRSPSETVRCFLGMILMAGMVLSLLGVLFIRSWAGLWNRYIR